MPRLSANISMLFTEVPLLERIGLARDHGFDAVECWFPYDHQPSEIRRALETNRMQMLGINTPPGDPAQGEFGFAALQGREADFEQSFNKALEYCVALDCPNIHVLSGRLDPGTNREHADDVFVANLSRAASRASAAGKTLLIEPLNPIDRPQYFLCRQAQASALIQRIANPSVKIMFDVYHVQMTEGNIVARLREHIDHIGHIQIADVPGRGEPGTGEINFEFVLAAIDEAGYEGWVGCEYKPVRGTVAGLDWRGKYVALRGRSLDALGQR